MTKPHFDVIVIGAGPGGEVAAIRAAQLGLKTALVEKRPHLGGTCLNVGCIPTKALLESAKLLRKFTKAQTQGFSFENFHYRWDKILERKTSIVDAQRKGLRFLMKKNQIECFEGVGHFLSTKELVVKNETEKTETTLKAEHFIIATGSVVRVPPGIDIDGKIIHTSDTIMDIPDIPKKVLVVGGGIVGLEFACLFSTFGSEVTVVELGSRIIASEDEESSKELHRCLKKNGIQIKTGVGLEKITPKKDSATVYTSDKEENTYDCVLLSIGRTPNTQALGLDKIRLHMDGNFIKTNSHYQTNIEHIFAIGDVIKTPALAHTASAEGIHAAEVIAGHSPKLIDYETNPSAIYTFPEVASIGKTEAQLKEASIPYKVAKFPFAPMAKAKIEEDTDGFIKILYSPEYRELLGVHIVGGKATELIAEFVLGKILETTVDEIAHAIHPHPTFSETVMEAAHAAVGAAIHM